MSFAKILPPAIREIRILCCQSSPSSAGARQFIQTNYPVIKQHNPDLPVLIREAKDTPARIFARFERGREQHVVVDNLSSSEVASQVLKLLNL